MSRRTVAEIDSAELAYLASIGSPFLLSTLNASRMARFLASGAIVATGESFNGVATYVVASPTVREIPLSLTEYLSIDARQTRYADARVLSLIDVPNYSEASAPIEKPVLVRWHVAYFVAGKPFTTVCLTDDEYGTSPADFPTMLSMRHDVAESAVEILAAMPL